MTINSKQKGKRGELSLVHILRDYGYESRRTVQYNGKAEEGQPDVTLPYIHAEVKNVEKLNMENAMEQAMRDSAGSGLIPAVFNKKSRQGWKVTMLLDDWMKLYNEFFSGKEIEKRLNEKEY